MSDLNSNYRSNLEAAKNESVGQLLFKCARLVNELGVARVRRGSRHTQFRHAHTMLFPHIDLEGTRLTELARRVDISKQAVGQLVNELESHGLLERIPDPSDGRARLIRFSEKGRSSLLEGLKVLGELETEITRKIGKRRMKALHESLTALLAALTDGSIS